MPSNTPFEIYSNDSLDARVFMRLFGAHEKVNKITIGSRFVAEITIRPPSFGKDVTAIKHGFDFFNHLIPLLRYEELKYAWAQYQKACKQRNYCKYYAFHNYLDGKRIKRLDRKGGVTQWV